ncbi:leucine-rich repeat protein [Pseudobutyrivibrio sp.]|uniref:leucine-rich repeat protein n=1 Tax=Pseudobutyrivibrio sp. TaxID=2014367 RepID=UPI0025F310B7|nr:leucine-rich repeat protein [Pseudobutyrivibrio sp.]
MKINNQIIYKDVSYLCHMRESLGGYYLEPIKCENDILYIPNHVDDIKVKGIIRGDLDTYSTIVLEENNTEFKTIEGVLFSFDGSVILLYPPQKKDLVYELPIGVQHVYEESIINHYIEKIVFPEGVTEIEQYSVYGFNLKTIVLPSTIKCIQCSAFKNNWTIKDVYYNGTKENWDKVVIGYENDDIINADIHFE